MPRTEATVWAVFASDGEATRLSRGWKPLVWVAGMEPRFARVFLRKIHESENTPQCTVC
jgi:hypothetical protein